MTGDSQADRVLARARALLGSGEIGSPLQIASGRIEAVIPVRTWDRELHSWFVPVTAGGRLAGFFQFLPDLTLMRFSSFQRREDSVEGCPLAESWLDLEIIRRRAQERARSGEKAGEPLLTYFQASSQLAWAVPMTSPGGASRTLLVAGNAVWEAPPPGAEIDSYGGSAPRP